MAYEYEKQATVALLSEDGSGNRKELCIVAWNGNPPKYDVRIWVNGGEKPGRGVTLTDSEAALLRGALNGLELDVPGGAG
ncbi:MAG: hypothetical protein LBS91_06445 [Clostridiales Family XIII bacterium]|jgi:hypothetical protein|nr:hypothetical protein [Clostridiales Family XIII bacterium]